MTENEEKTEEKTEEEKKDAEHEDTADRVSE